MSAERFLPSSHVGRLVAALVAAGRRVFGPAVVNGRSVYHAVAGPDDLDMNAPPPALPLKALFFPPSEVLLTWRQERGDVSLTPVPTTFTPAVVLGARPCDAAGIEILDKVMGWDYRDELWFGRREATTIVSLACSAPDADCFCETVGLAPDSTRGSDVLLHEVSGGYRAVALTDKGEAIFELGREAFEAARPADAPAAAVGEAARAKAAAAAGRLAAMTEYLSTHFDDALWTSIGLRCHGCGACASVCPTCHCFDIVDEPDGYQGGARRRNWDACQASKFTMHASGHNPRGDQNARFRQRVLHKFSIYPQRFGLTLCTGCGRCTRVCAAGQNLPEILAEVARLAGQGPGPQGAAEAESRS
jgi:ferredoxin